MSKQSKLLFKANLSIKDKKLITLKDTGSLFTNGVTAEEAVDAMKKISRQSPIHLKEEEKLVCLKK